MQDASPTKLLIVDDLPENLQALDALIRGPGREVFQAGSGEEALDRIRADEFAVVEPTRFFAVRRG